MNLNERLQLNKLLDKNKVEFYDDVVDSTTTFEISKVAKILNFIQVGRNNLFEILREQVPKS